MAFSEVNARYDGPAIETDVLAFWKNRDIFERTLAMSEGRPLFTFCEGPPTANGRPGIHHVLARTFKDVYPRYRTMRGYHVPRKAGWDTHGLPVEHEVEKELGIFDKQRIEEEVGVAEFTRRCRESVMRYIGDWEKMTERMGFWVNMEEAYYTLNNSYIESVWHLLKTMWDKGLIYQGYKVVPYDPRIGATLSSAEVSLGYKEVEDPSVFVRFQASDEPGVSFLVWTTTPWTLPSNLALAVGADIDYVYAESGGETLVVAESLLEHVFRGADYQIVKRLKGAQMVGRRYERLLDYLPVEASDAASCWRVLDADFVSTEDGTGIVHCAAAYGEDDLKLCQANGMPVVHGVGLDGYFLPEVTPVAGKFFKDADPILIELLTERGAMFRAERYLHNYPFGWRTGDPLIYYAKQAWYIRTSQFRDRLVELNKTINWVPENIRDGRFGNWLENNIDWALSRERFWGTPFPVWTDGEGDFRCIGSVAELENLTGRSLSELDLHRPAVDDITFVDPDNGRTYRRLPEVIDCWFDSGAMSYAQWHYPFENKEIFENHFPADYICEAIDQTRGWFYTLHAIATLVSDDVAFKNCVCLSHIVDGEGKKMSKSQGNIVNPYDVFDSVGADALRWHFLARVAPDGQKRISVDIIAEVAASFLNTLWNTYAFFVLYARLDDVDLARDVPVDERPQIDRWVLALLHQTIATTTDAMDAFDARRAGDAIESFVDQLSNWYVRRNRRRFWKAVQGDDKQAAYLTLYECLCGVQQLIAPFMPFVAEQMYQNLVMNQGREAPESVHMSAWPESERALIDTQLLADFDAVQKVVGLGRSAREAETLRVRQPLARVLVRVPGKAEADSIMRLTDQIMEELNIKEVVTLAQDDGLLSYRIKPNLPRVGKRYGKLIPKIRAALESADTEAIARQVAAGQVVTMEIEGQTLEFEPEDLLVESESAAGYACAEDLGYLVALDTTLTPELEREGLAREIVRTIQDSRKQAGLNIDDRIELHLGGSPAVLDAVATHREFIANEVLATGWADANDGAAHRVERNLGDEQLRVQFSVA
ncbi:MAG: isoleucine--tRNA ligase [Pseudomonadota bacterium]